jgi:hypothetical protein
MLASFADIKSAIEEMGGSVSGGYATYAQGVRLIYSSDSYTPQNTYPEKSAFLTTNICNQILFCAACKEEIRQAIIDGGVECGTDVPLSEYGNKIREISVFEIVTNTLLPYAECYTEYSAQLEARGGKPPYTWAFAGGIKPVGITINSDGSVTGTPVRNGGYGAVRVTCTDSTGKTLQKTISIYVIGKTLYFKVVGGTEFYYDGEVHTLNVVCTNDDNAEFYLTYGGYTNTTGVTEMGTYSVDVFLTGDNKNNYKVSSDTSLYISIDARQVTINATKNQTYTYDGEPHAFEFTTEPECETIVKYKIYDADDDTFTVDEDTYTTDPPTNTGKYRVYIKANQKGTYVSQYYAGYNKWFGTLTIEQEDVEIV